MSCHRVCSEMVFILYESNWLNVLSQRVQWNGFAPVFMELAECLVTEYELKWVFSCMNGIGWMCCHRGCSEMVFILYEWNWLNVLSQRVQWNGFFSCMNGIGWMCCHRGCSEMVLLLYEWNWLNVLSQRVQWNGFASVWMELAECLVTKCALEWFFSCMGPLVQFSSRIFLV